MYRVIPADLQRSQRLKGQRTATASAANFTARCTVRRGRNSHNFCTSLPDVRTTLLARFFTGSNILQRNSVPCQICRMQHVRAKAFNTHAQLVKEFSNCPADTNLVCPAQLATRAVPAMLKPSWHP